MFLILWLVWLQCTLTRLLFLMQNWNCIVYSSCLMSGHMGTAGQELTNHKQNLGSIYDLEAHVMSKSGKQQEE